MVPLHVSLFGKFCAHCGDQAVDSLDAYKVQELFCYLLLHPDQPHHREKLAGLLWEEQPAVQSKNYLRRTLWQLQNALKSQNGSEPLLQVESDWIQLTPTTQLWVDAAVFELAFMHTNGKQVSSLDETAVNALIQAVQLYNGDLLEGWYQNWCLFERERFRQMLLLMLDKLMAYCEGCGAYEVAITYGMIILRCDLARERTHRQLMRLYYLGGDRTGALRQYERCKAILHDELGVKPGAATDQLRTQIEADQLALPLLDSSGASDSPSGLQYALLQLQRFDNILSQTRQEIQQEIHRLENTFFQSKE
ncbi:MAG: BTAD domain-containing putative transcriptional regulator [Chloroflexota bacterium]